MWPYSYIFCFVLQFCARRFAFEFYIIIEQVQENIEDLGTSVFRNVELFVADSAEIFREVWWLTAELILEETF